MAQMWLRCVTLNISAVRLPRMRFDPSDVSAHGAADVPDGIQLCNSRAISIAPGQ